MDCFGIVAAAVGFLFLDECLRVGNVGGTDFFGDTALLTIVFEYFNHPANEGLHTTSSEDEQIYW